MRCVYITACLFLCLVAAGTASAQDPRDSQTSGDVQLVKPFVGETTFLIVKVDPARIQPPDAAALDSPSPETKAALDQVSKRLTALLEQLRALADGQPVFASVGIPLSKTRTPIFLFRRKSSDNNAENVKAFMKQFNGEVYVEGDLLVAAPHGGAKNARSITSTAGEGQRVGQVQAALQGVAGYPIQLVVLPPDYLWRTVKELLPELPRQLGGGPSRVLTDGVQWVGIGFDPQRFRLEVVVQSAGDQGARAFAAHLPAMLRSMYKEAKPLHSHIPAKVIDRLIGLVKPEVEGSHVKLRIDGFERNSVHLALLARLAQVIGQTRRQNSQQQRFRQILIAMHNYHETYQMFPPADKRRNQNGKHGLSWRVHILPFVEQQALYEQFNLEEPWDSSHNKKLIAKMPDIYANNPIDFMQKKDKVDIKPGNTTILAPVGERTIFGGAKATKISQITDGTSNTVMLLEVTPERGVPWTAPADFSFDPQNPLAGVLIGSDGKWMCGIADGSVHRFRGNIPPKMALHSFQMNDGNPIDLDQIR